MFKIVESLKANIDFQYLSESTLELLKFYIAEHKNGFLKEYNDNLLTTQKISISDLELEYSRTSIVFDKNRVEPYLLTSINLNHPKKQITLFVFTVELGLSGSILDEYWEKF